MKLRSCHIENFGKLSDMTVNFSEDMHIIMEENGFGKTTLAAFIKVMFYGFTGDGKKNITENERRRYKPWQGGVYGGQLVFETEGKSYQIVRTFGIREKEDTFSLYDEATGRETGDFTSNIGEELFKIDRDAFVRTVFIGQQSCETNVSDSISAKIGNLSENTDDINNYENVQKRLKDMLNAMSPTRATGTIKNMENKIGDIRVSILRGDEIDRSIDALNEKLEIENKKKAALKETLTQVKESIEKASSEGELLAKLKLYERLCKAYDEAEKRREKCPGWEPEDAPDNEDINRYIRLWSRRNEKKTALNAKKSELESVEAELVRPVRAVNKPLLLLGITIFITGIILTVVYHSVGLLMALPGLGLIVAALFYKKKPQKKEENEEWLQLFSEINNDESYIKDAGKTIESYLRKYDINCNVETHMPDILYNLKEQSTQYRHALDEWNRAKAEKKAFEAENDMERIRSFKPDYELSSIDSLNKELSRVTEELEAVQSNILSYMRQRDSLKEERDLISEEEESLSNLESEKEKLQRKYDSLKLTKTLLEKAKDSFTSKYTKPVKNSFNKYYKILTGEAADSYDIDAAINISIMEMGDKRDVSLLSRGCKDLVGLCMRMALIDAMYKEEKPFIILDDPFVNFDDERLSGGISFLKEISKEYQVIYFTCHESRSY